MSATTNLAERGLLFRHLEDVRRETPGATWEVMGREVRRRMESNGKELTT